MWKKLLFLWLAMTLSALAAPAKSPRGLCSFDIPGNLVPHGNLVWGNYPGIVIEMREEFSESKEMKPFILSVAPTTPDGKKSSEGAEVDGAEGVVITRKEGTSNYKYLILRRGNYNFAWSVQFNNVPGDEATAIFERLKESIKFAPDPMSSGESREVRDPSGALVVKLPGGFGGGGHKYSNGQVMILLTPLREATAETQKDFANNYIPKGYISYMRRNHVEVGGKDGAMILATSEDGLMETQMVLLMQGKSGVVLTFVGPAKQRQQLSLMRESVVSGASWANSAKKDE